MKISTRGRYALRFMTDLAQQTQGANLTNGDFIALKDISERQGISIKYLEQIASLLSKAGLLISVRGSKGGYKLAKSPDKYSVAEILQVTEGDMAPVACLEGTQNICPRRYICPTLSVWKGLQKVIFDYLEGKTLQNIVDEAETTENYNYFI